MLLLIDRHSMNLMLSPLAALRYSWWYARYNHHAWHHEFVIMGRKAALSASVYIDSIPLLCVVYSMVVVVLSVAQQKRSKPYLAGKHVIREAELDGATITRGDDTRPGCCRRCCSTFASSLVVLAVSLACLVYSVGIGEMQDPASAMVGVLAMLGCLICSPLLLCTNIVRFCCPPIQDPVTLTVTSSGQSYSLVVARQQSEALVAAGKVFSREHETDVDGDGEQESGADKLEVAALLCALGNYVVAALSYLVNQNKSDDDRSFALDIVIFFAAVIFTVTPFFLALKYRKHEDAFINKGRVNQVDVEQKGP